MKKQDNAYDPQSDKRSSDGTVQPANSEYQPPAILEVVQLEAMATACSGTNAKSDTALGCNVSNLDS